MKKILGILLAMFMLTGNCLAQQTASALKLSQLPTDFSSLKVDPQKYITLPYSGFFERKVEVDGTARTYKMYVPEGTEAAMPVVFVVPDSKREPLEFLEHSGWKNIADKNKLILFLPEAKNTWDLQTGETKYLNTILAETRKRTYFLSYAANYYIVGYGDGATIAQQFAMTNPTVWAGMATFGELKVSDQYMMEAGNKASDISYVPLKEVPLPVWCITQNVSGQTEKVINYWKRANNSENAYYSNQYANYVYFPSQIYKTSEIDDENIAKVLVTTNKDTAKDDQKLNEVVWSEFLNKTRRYLGIANGDLRSYADPEQLGAVKKTMDVDGYQREWYEYVPASVKANPNKKVPLVVAMHGRSGTGKEFVGRSGWIKVAEERNFIVVFPTSSITKDNKKAVPNTIWNLKNDNTMMADVKFLRLLVENNKANHTIDSGRVYGTGQSMGSMMSHAISLYLPDIFTATGSTSGPNLDGLNENMPGVNLNYDIPYMVIIGDKDVYANQQSDPLKNEVIKEQLNYFINRYQTTAIDQPATYKNGPYNHRVYYTKDGVPMVHYVNVDNLVHANVPAESWMIYDEFLCKFYRDETGKIIYEKGDQEGNQQTNQRLSNKNTSPLD